MADRRPLPFQIRPMPGALYHTSCENCRQRRPLVGYRDVRVSSSLTLERCYRALCVACRDRAVARQSRAGAA